MKLPDTAKEILEANKEILENNKFQDFFSNISIYDRVMFAEFFYLDCNINFLEYMSYITGSLFARSYNLTNISIPSTIDTIYPEAFYKCPILRYVKIPDSVDGIADSAFNRCPNLTIGCKKDSFAEKYAKEHEIDIDYI